MLILSLMVPLFSIGATQACRWRGPTIGNMDLAFLGRQSESGDPGYPDSVLTWDGTISRDVTGHMIFWLLKFEMEGPNQDWTHFWEIWQIFDDAGTLLMQGNDEGYAAPNGKYAMIGRVTYATGPYSRLEDHIVFMYGTIDWVIPFMEGTAPGTFIVF
ncbi:MAG: hypothetical protein ACFFBR_04475 [Promethearchaeota archaeon]